MLIQSIAIGSEILKGVTVNTNSSFISSTLKKLGLEVSKHLVISDEKNGISLELNHAIRNYDLTVISGGLGPTLDDLTKQIASEVISSKLELNQEVLADLKARYPHLSTIENQAQQIKGATLLKNILGTAWGFILEKDSKFLVFLPGVPKEFESIVLNELVPWLRKKYPEAIYHEKNYLVLNKREHELDPLLRQINQDAPDVEIGIYPNYGYLNVYLTSKNLKALDTQSKIFEAHVHDYIVENVTNPQEALHQILKDEKITLSIAESCTGGKVSEKLTSLSDASLFFKGSIVAYANEVKTNILKVDPMIISQHGAVSSECAEAMALNVKKIFSADLSLAVTGVAGPKGGTQEKPVGTVFLSIAYKDQVYSGQLPLVRYPSRDIVTSYAANYLIGKAYQLIRFKKAPF